MASLLRWNPSILKNRPSLTGPRFDAFAPGVASRWRVVFQRRRQGLAYGGRSSLSRMPCSPGAWGIFMQRIGADASPWLIDGARLDNKS
jgi:hypothetical protein